MTFKPCRNQCGTTIEVRNVDGKWIPYEESGKKHDCPNSDYNKKKAANGGIKQLVKEDTIIAAHKGERVEITEQEKQHEEPAVYEAQEKPRYPQHRIELTKASNLADLQGQVNTLLADNDREGYIHKGVTLMLDDLEQHEYSYIACIHYEILQPREERMK